MISQILLFLLYQVDLLTGDKSPLVGYNGVFVEESCLEHWCMCFWGRDIPLENALHVKVSRNFDKFSDDSARFNCCVPYETFVSRIDTMSDISLRLRE